MERTRPVLLLVESAWRGNNGGWRNRIVGYEDIEDNPLRELVQYCRSNGIPTVFWNKEDPPHFDNFLGAAREFDFVFTSDADCVPRYRKALGNDRIYVLPFAAQPRLHNRPREEGWPNYPVCFPGSWVPRRYPERAETLRYLLDPAIPHGLHIFDRNLTRTDFGRTTVSRIGTGGDQGNPHLRRDADGIPLLRRAPEREHRNPSLQRCLPAGSSKAWRVAHPLYPRSPLV